MRARALVHVGGPTGAGKTTFIERLLEAATTLAVCVRAERDIELRTEQETVPSTHLELRRYRKAGASDVALYRFAKPSMDALFSSRVMEGYSQAVFIEGDCPIDDVDLAVFVAPVSMRAKGVTMERSSLLRRVVRDHASAHAAALDQLADALESPKAIARLLGAGLAEPVVGMMLTRPEFLDDLRRSMAAHLSQARRAPPPPPTSHWALESGYEGIERAQLVIVNVRGGDDLSGAQALIDDVARLRKDAEVFRDVIGRRGSKLPITVVAADLANAKDEGLKRALARVKRTTHRRTQ